MSEEKDKITKTLKSIQDARELLYAASDNLRTVYNDLPDLEAFGSRQVIDMTITYLQLSRNSLWSRVEKLCELHNVEIFSLNDSEGIKFRD